MCVWKGIWGVWLSLSERWALRLISRVYPLESVREEEQKSHGKVEGASCVCACVSLCVQEEKDARVRPDKERLRARLSRSCARCGFS